MSALGPVNIIQSLTNQNLTQEPSYQIPQRAGVVQSAQQPRTLPEDQFTPSTLSGQSQDTAQAAGIFTVPQPLALSPAASLLIAQNGAVPANQVAAAPSVANGSATTPQSGATNAPVQQETTSAVSAPTAKAATASSRGPTASLAAAQEQLQALNLALAALGLNTQDIQQLDQIASTINDYNPSAYTSRAYQLEVLAHRNPPQPASEVTKNPQPTTKTANATVPNPKVANP
jgi:hypothetical protein